jgi:hypothetical protein
MSIPIPKVTMCKDKDGYWVCHKPGSGGRGQQLRVHKWILEMKLGRPLEPDEVAHHICHDRGCLDSDHLEAVSRSDHSYYHVFGRRWTPAQKLARSDMFRRLWATREYRDKVVAERKARADQIAAQMRKLWRNPEYRARQAATRGWTQ